jgi:DnaD/phage-associated family protein
MSPGNIDQFRQLQEDGMQDDAIKMAVDIAAARNSRTWGFVYGILRRWAEQGVWTAGDAKAAEDAYRAQKARAAPGRPRDTRADFFFGTGGGT